MTGSHDRWNGARLRIMGFVAMALVTTGCNEPDPASGATAHATPERPALPQPSPMPSGNSAVEPAPEPVEEPSPAAAPATDSPSYAPQDQCARLPGWSAFQGKLDHAIESRNAAELVELAAADITLDYGGGQGRAELSERLNSPEAGAALWADLARLRTMGCAEKDGLAALPWFFWNLPETLDPAASMLTVGPAVPVKAKPSPSAPTVAKLDWAIVTLLPGFDSATPFTHVQTETGEKGYVETKLLRSVLARRLIAESRDGIWELTALVSGD